MIFLFFLLKKDAGYLDTKFEKKKFQKKKKKKKKEKKKSIKEMNNTHSYVCDVLYKPYNENTNDEDIIKYDNCTLNINEDKIHLLDNNDTFLLNEYIISIDIIMKNNLICLNQMYYLDLVNWKELLYKLINHQNNFMDIYNKTISIEIDPLQSEDIIDHHKINDDIENLKRQNQSLQSRLYLSHIEPDLSTIKEQQQVEEEEEEEEAIDEKKMKLH